MVSKEVLLLCRSTWYTTSSSGYELRLLLLHRIRFFGKITRMLTWKSLLLLVLEIEFTSLSLLESLLIADWYQVNMYRTYEFLPAYKCNLIIIILFAGWRLFDCLSNKAIPACEIQDSLKCMQVGTILTDVVLTKLPGVSILTLTNTIEAASAIPTTYVLAR